MASGLNIFFIKGKAVFSNAPKILLKNLPDCTILCNWVFNNFVLAEELFAKVLQSLENCALVNNNLCEKLFSPLESLPAFDEILQNYFGTIFIPDFNLLSCKLHNFTFKMLQWHILY